MYGLFRFTYDHFQFQRLECVSRSAEALEARYAQLKAADRYLFDLIPAEKHDEFWDMEENHYCIMPVEEV